MKDDRFITNLDYNDMELVNSLLNYEVEDDEEDEEKNEWYKELKEDLDASRWPL